MNDDINITQPVNSATKLIHFVNHAPLNGPWLKPYRKIYFAMGCFWGAEKLFWQQDGVIVTAVGYSGGKLVNPTYEQICRGDTGHAETVMVVYNPELVTLGQLLSLFWQEHDPTQGMRQGNDIGSNYRSAIYVTDHRDLLIAEKSRSDYQKQLSSHGLGVITTEIKLLDIFYFAEPYHQQYLAKNPNGYCGLKGTGVMCR